MLLVMWSIAVIVDISPVCSSHILFSELVHPTDEGGVWLAGRSTGPVITSLPTHMSTQYSQGRCHCIGKGRWNSIWCIG